MLSNNIHPLLGKSILSYYRKLITFQFDQVTGRIILNEMYLKEALKGANQNTVMQMECTYFYNFYLLIQV